jgi:hypothetical protein
MPAADGWRLIADRWPLAVDRWLNAGHHEGSS